LGLRLRPNADAVQCMHKKLGLTVALLLLGSSLGCSSSPNAASTADTIYFGGPIITVNDAQPTAEAVAIKDGKILMVGARSDLLHVHPAFGFGDQSEWHRMRVCDLCNLEHRFQGISVRQIAPTFRLSLLTVFPGKSMCHIFDARGRFRVSVGLARIYFESSPRSVYANVKEKLCATVFWPLV